MVALGVALEHRAIPYCFTSLCKQVGLAQAGMGLKAAKQMRGHLGQQLAGSQHETPVHFGLYLCIISM